MLKLFRSPTAHGRSERRSAEAARPDSGAALIQSAGESHPASSGPAPDFPVASDRCGASLSEARA